MYVHYNISISLHPPSFQCLPLTCLLLRIWHTLSSLPMTAHGLSPIIWMIVYSILSNSTDFHNGPFIYSPHLIHFHMDPAWSVALGESYFTHHSYLVVHCWIQATIITPVWAQNVLRNVWVFKGVVGHKQNGAPCYCIIIILHSLFHHVTTTFPLPWLVSVIMLLSIDTTHIHCKVNIWLLLFFNDAQPLQPMANPPWPGPDYFWPVIMLTLWHIVLQSGHIRLIYPCIVLLWIRAYMGSVTFVIITIPVITAQSHICAMVHVHACMDHKKCHSVLLGQCPWRQPVSVFWSWQSGL